MEEDEGNPVSKRLGDRFLGRRRRKNRQLFITTVSCIQEHCVVSLCVNCYFKVRIALCELIILNYR